MAKAELPSPELLRKLLRYDPETGQLFWRARPVSLFRAGHFSAEHNAAKWNTRYAGKPTTPSLGSEGYARCTINGRLYHAHRIIWALHYGEWPEGCIDHINRDRADNRISNLRVVTVAENNKNRSLQTNNTSGVAGVCWKACRSLWRAQINHHGEVLWLGDFPKRRQAIAARRDAERRYGYHENHGKPT